MKIAIIGGGFTGVVGAYRLAMLGHEVVLIEKSPSLGGLASGFKLAGEYEIEKAYHHIFATDLDVINLINELNLSKYLSWNKSSIGMFYNNNLYSFTTPLDLIRMPILSPLGKFKFFLFSLHLKYSNNISYFENISAYSWLKRYMGEEVTEIIWKPLLIGKFGDAYDKVSMAWLWARIHTRINSRKNIKDELLGYMDGSFYRIIETLKQRFLLLNVQVLLNTVIKEIIPSEDNVILKFDEGEKKFDKVFCTFSNTTFVNYFDKVVVNQEQRDYLNKLKKIKYMDSICILFQSSQNLSKFYWHNINDLKLPFLVFIQHTNLVDYSFYGNNHVYYMGKYFHKDNPILMKDDNSIIRLWFDGLKNIFPNFNENNVNQVYVFRFKDAQHIVEVNYSKFIPDYHTPFRNVYLINFSQIYPEDRGINFAVREGNKFVDILHKI